MNRAPLEEMLQRAGANPGVGGDTRGPPVPQGPPVNAPMNSGDKGFNFTPLS